MRYVLVIILPLLVLLSSCGGSDVYRGLWNATNNKGTKFQINFEENNFNVKKADSIIAQYEYTQNSISIENGISTYGIQLKNGLTYNIVFPKSDNKTVALITLENNQAIYTLSRTDYIEYQDLYKLEE